jgi:hypothetical protein
MQRFSIFCLVRLIAIPVWIVFVQAIGKFHYSFRLRRFIRRLYVMVQ